MDDEKKTDTRCNRRNFLGKGGLAAFLGAVGVAGVGSVIGLKPSVLPDPSEQFKIGPPQDYPVGTRVVFDKESVVFCSDHDGFYAISMVCTHLGCIVTLNKDEERFDCPCHGSKFDMAGRVQKAPAPKALPWFQVSLHPSGQLVIDRSTTVDMGTKVTV